MNSATALIVLVILAVPILVFVLRSNKNMLKHQPTGETRDSSEPRGIIQAKGEPFDIPIDPHSNEYSEDVRLK